MKSNVKLMLMGNKISLNFLVGLMILSGLLMSFQQDISAPLSVQQLIDIEVEKKISTYRSVRLKKCHQELLIEAANRADSIVISRIKALKIVKDTIGRPPVPGRPLRPDLLTPIDSSAAAPLLDSVGE